MKNLSLLFITFLLFHLVSNAQQNLYVGVGQTYTTIQTAINAASDGDKIFIVDEIHIESGINVNKSVRIIGNDFNSKKIKAHETQGSATDRIFYIDEGVQVNLEYLDLENGKIIGDPARGGAIYNAGNLHLIGCIVQFNEALGINGSSHGGDAEGGGIYNSGVLSFQSGFFSGFIRFNDAVGGNATDISAYAGDGKGGGIFNAGTLNLITCNVSTNEAIGGNNNSIGGGAGYAFGGGIYNANQADLEIDRCTIKDNTALGGLGEEFLGMIITGGYAEGGGIYINGNHELSIEKSTISGNIAQGGNADMAPGVAEGGGIKLLGVYSYVHNIVNCTISGNQAISGTGSSGTASSLGGGFNGVANGLLGGPANNLFIINCTIADNYATHGGGLFSGNGGDNQGPIIKNTMIADNTGTNGADIYGQIQSRGYNLIEDNSYGTIDIDGNNNTNVGNLFGQDPILLPLAENNSIFYWCFTHAFLFDSPAKNALPSGGNGAPLTDQRGAERNGNPDIGAYEYWDDAGSLPVELTSFTAISNGDNINLKWETETEVDNYGFEVQRAVFGVLITEWKKIGFVEGHGNSNSPKQYSFRDTNPSGGSKFLYRLKQINTDGEYEYSDEVEVELLPAEYSLYHNFPNPFNPGTNIKFSLPEPAKVSIIIYNSLGELVTELVNRDFDAGYHKVEFNANNYASGVYIYRLVSKNFVDTKKMVLLR